VAKYARKAINNMHGYVPGEQPKPGEKVISEYERNPYPPAPTVAKL
jgi:histidinol-phosphate aminotransferase